MSDTRKFRKLMEYAVDNCPVCNGGEDRRGELEAGSWASACRYCEPFRDMLAELRRQRRKAAETA